MAFTALASGCEFFGKEVPKVDDGTSGSGSLEAVPALYQGTWSYIDVSPSLTNAPGSAYLTQFTFSADEDSRFQYEGLITGSPSVNLTGISALDNQLPALLIALTAGTDPTSSFIGKTLQLTNPQVTGATMTYGSSSSGTRYLYADPALAIAPPQGAWNFSAAGLDFLIMTTGGYAVAQMRDENDAPVLLDAIARPDVDGSLTLEFFAVQPENSLGSYFFYSYALEPNGDLVIEDADGVYVGTKL